MTIQEKDSMAHQKATANGAAREIPHFGAHIVPGDVLQRGHLEAIWQ
ncbi:MAG: hypothetical protein GF309_07015 [Candidatus Lokiarchaeota archaeon]|nr:hypothetical protein [Candidatus Lokiarchaeota archaeon]